MSALKTTRSADFGEARGWSSIAPEWDRVATRFGESLTLGQGGPLAIGPLAEEGHSAEGRLALGQLALGRLALGRLALGRRDLVTMFGSQVWLRPYAHGFGYAELRALYRWANDPELLLLAGGMPLRLPFDAFRRQFLSQLGRQNGPRQQLFAVLSTDGSFIGRAGLFQVGDSGLSPGCVGEVGIVIGERNCWARGIGREAVMLLARYGFNVLGLGALVLHVYADNERAQRAFAAAGFETTATLRRFSLDRGSHTEIEMTLTPEALLR